jgi:membrane fusion protein, multidrug efflux system
MTSKPTLLLLLFVVLAGCLLAFGIAIYMKGSMEAVLDRGKALFTQRAGPPPPPQPPPEVAVIEVRPVEAPLPVEFAGRVAGFREVEVRSRVGGPILKREYREGDRVSEGQVLFRIDPATYEVERARAEAQLAQAQAQATQAEQNFTRVQQLATRDVASRQQLDEARAQRDLTRAAAKLAEAAVNAAKLNISYTTITAPIAGVTAVESPPEGTLVIAQETVLTLITQLDPAYVDFSLTDAQYKAFRELNQRRRQPIKPEDLIVELHYGDGTVYPLTGRIEIAAKTVAPDTGTIEVRAIFPNADGAILPGQFVRIAVQGVTLPDAIVVPERAIAQGPQGASVFVVNADARAESRNVRLGPQVASGYVIEDGLRLGDRVVVDGLIRVRPGTPVKAVAADGAALASAPRSEEARRANQAAAPPAAQGARE